MKGLIEAAGEIGDENELIQTEIDSLRDSINQLEEDIAKIQSEHAPLLKKYKKKRKKIKKLMLLKGLAEWNSSDSDSD